MKRFSQPNVLNVHLAVPVWHTFGGRGSIAAFVTGNSWYG